MENESKNKVIASLEEKRENSYEKALRDSKKIEALSKALEGKEVVENKLVIFINRKYFLFISTGFKV